MKKYILHPSPFPQTSLLCPSLMINGPAFPFYAGRPPLTVAMAMQTAPPSIKKKNPYYFSPPSTVAGEKPPQNASPGLSAPQLCLLCVLEHGPSSLSGDCLSFFTLSKLCPFWSQQPLEHFYQETEKISVYLLIPSAN